MKCLIILQLEKFVKIFLNMKNYLKIFQKDLQNKLRKIEEYRGERFIQQLIFCFKVLLDMWLIGKHQKSKIIKELH